MVTAGGTAGGSMGLVGGTFSESVQYFIWSKTVQV